MAQGRPHCKVDVEKFLQTRKIFKTVTAQVRVFEIFHPIIPGTSLEIGRFLRGDSAAGTGNLRGPFFFTCFPQHLDVLFFQQY